MRREGPSLFRDKAWQEIGLAGGHQFLHLFFWNDSMQNCFAYEKAAHLGYGGSSLADIGILHLENLALLAHWTDADGLVSPRIDLFGRAVSALAEVEFLLEIFAQFYGCVKGAPYFAAESFERANAALCEELLNFSGLK